MPLYAGSTRFKRTFVQYLIAFCSRPEGRFVRLILPDKSVKFRDTRLYRSLEIPPEAVRGSIFNRFLKLP